MVAQAINHLIISFSYNFANKTCRHYSITFPEDFGRELGVEGRTVQETSLFGLCLFFYKSGITSLAGLLGAQSLYDRNISN